MKNVTLLDRGRIERAKMAYTTRRVPIGVLRTIVCGRVRPQPGDLVLAQVIELGFQRRFELCSGRFSQLYLGDEVVMCFGNRYSPDQFEVELSGHLSDSDLVAAGGIAAQTLSTYKDIDPPTRLKPVGLAADHEPTVVGDGQFAGRGRGVVEAAIELTEVCLEFAERNGRVVESSDHLGLLCWGPEDPGSGDS